MNRATSRLTRRVIKNKCLLQKCEFKKRYRVNHSVKSQVSLIVGRWLDDIGANDVKLSPSRCTYCHTENATTAVAADIESNGFYILQMEGCPNPRW